MKKRLDTLIFTVIIALAAVVLTACGDTGDTQDEAAQPRHEVSGQGASQQATSEPQDIEGARVSDSDTATPEADGGSIASSADGTTQNDEIQAAPYFTFQMRDVIIEMDQDITYVIERFGEPLGVFEQPSCAFDGIDRIFGFPGVQIYTYPKGDADHIHTISLRDDMTRTLEGGIRLGSTLNAVIEAYGDDYVYDSGMYIFTRGLTKLEFLIADGAVIGITYGFIIE